MNKQVLILAFVVTYLGAIAAAEAQIDFDHPEVMRTSFPQQAEAKAGKQLKDSAKSVTESFSPPTPAESAPNVAESSLENMGVSPAEVLHSNYDSAFAPHLIAPNGCGCDGGGTGFANQYDTGGSAPGRSGFLNRLRGCDGGLRGRLTGLADRGRLFVGGRVFDRCSGSSHCNSGCCGAESFGGFGNGCNDVCGSVGGGSNIGLMVSGIVQVPLDGVFHTGADSRTTAGAIGADPLVFAPATPIDLLFDEMGFEDIYRTFGGVETNLHFQRGTNTSMFVGYRFLQGRANDAVTVGTAVENPLTVPGNYDINATFSEFRESALQAGFLTSQCLTGNVDFLWGGRMGIGFVDEISVDLDIPSVATLTDVRFYDNTTNLNFDFNFGFRRRMGCHLSAHILTGVQYRTSLNGFDGDLAALGLEELNDGSGFVSLPVYMGVTYRR